MDLNQLKRIRWAVRGALVLGVTASVTANVLHAEPNPISEVIAAWPPLALLLTIELISRIPVHRRWLGVVRLTATVAIAGIAAWVSYWHMASVVSRYGETGATPYLLPFSVDGLVAVASVCLVEIGGRIRVAEPKLAFEAVVVPTEPAEPNRAVKVEPAAPKPVETPKRTAPKKVAARLAEPDSNITRIARPSKGRTDEQLMPTVRKLVEASYAERGRAPGIGSTRAQLGINYDRTKVLIERAVAEREANQEAEPAAADDDKERVA